MGSEIELGRTVREWLASGNWDVYQEIQFTSLGRRADIVAKRGPVVWIIELKNSLSLAVLAQAIDWLDYAHLISIAVPESKRHDKSRWFGVRVAREHRIGIISVGHRCHSELGAFDRKPRVLRYLLPALTEERKSWAEAGSKDNYYTPFRHTVEDLKRILREKGPSNMRTIMTELDHHYSSDRTARSALATWINKGVINGIGCKREGRENIYFLESTNDPA
jgi:hypothetical protein